MTRNISNTDHMTSNMSNKFDSDVGVFDIFGENFKAELAMNTILAMKSDTLDVYNSGPFRNARTKLTHKCCCTLEFQKSLGIEGIIPLYLPSHIFREMNSMKSSKIDFNHCHSYYEINTKKHKFGTENV
jgi:hypothetical protein